MLGSLPNRSSPVPIGEKKTPSQMGWTPAKFDETAQFQELLTVAQRWGRGRGITSVLALLTIPCKGSSSEVTIKTAPGGGGEGGG